MKTAPLKIEAFEITELDSPPHRLDPIRVFIQDLAPGRGRIVIECFGESWSAFWPAMGKDATVAAFFIISPTDYLVDNLLRHQGAVAVRTFRKRDYLTRIIEAVKLGLVEEAVRKTPREKLNVVADSMADVRAFLQNRNLTLGDINLLTCPLKAIGIRLTGDVLHVASGFGDETDEPSPRTKEIINAWTTRGGTVA